MLYKPALEFGTRNKLAQEMDKQSSEPIAHSFLGGALRNGWLEDFLLGSGGPGLHSTHRSKSQDDYQGSWEINLLKWFSV